MKVNMIAAALSGLALSVAALAESPAGGQDSSAGSMPKNLARQHLGANLLIYNASNQTYAPTEAAAAWLDDDIATGWPAQTGKQDYLLALPEPSLVNNFAISAKSVAGTVTLYAGDEAAPPGAKSWTVLEKDVPIDSINEKLSKPFGRFTKYVLIETNLTDSGPWYSVYLYGAKSATAYKIQARAQPVDPRTVFGPYTNPQTSFSLSSLYAHSKVTLAGGNSGSWAQAIDDNPETGVFIAATQNAPGLAIQFDKSYSIQRISVLTDAGTKGKLDFYIANAPAKAGDTTASNDGSHYIRVANPEQDSSTATDLGTPVATVNFDGSSPRASVDFTPASGTKLMARWTPDTAGQPLNLREVNSFGDVALNDYELAPEGVSEGPGSGRQDYSKEGAGKETLPAVGEDGAPPAVGEALPPKTPFIPGVPVFPPNVPFSP